MFKINELCIIFPSSNHSEYIHSPHKVTERFLLIFRSISLIINLTVCGIVMFQIGNRNFWRFFTQWGLVLTSITLVFLPFSYISSQPITESKDKCLRRGRMNYICLILYEMCWTTECLITLVFWCVLLPMLIGDISNWISNGGNAVLVYITIFGAHLTPIIWLILEAIFSKFRFVPGHIWFSFGFTLLYMIVDIICTFVNGESAYPMLTYKDWLTPLVLIAFLALLIAFFLLGFWLHERKFRGNRNEIQGEEQGEYSHL